MLAVQRSRDRVPMRMISHDIVLVMLYLMIRGVVRRILRVTDRGTAHVAFLEEDRGVGIRVVFLVTGQGADRAAVHEAGHANSRSVIREIGRPVIDVNIVLVHHLGAFAEYTVYCMKH